MSWALLALLPAGILSGAVAGAAIGWARALPSPLLLAGLLGLGCAAAAALAVRAAWLRAPGQAAFFLPMAAALPLGLLL